MKRASFLSLLLGGLGGLILILKSPKTVFKRTSASSNPDFKLDSNSIKTLSIISAYIFPKTNSPGALELGIEDFYHRQLSTQYYIPLHSSIKKGLHLVDGAASAMAQRPFRKLPPNQQSKLIQRFSQGMLGENPQECRYLFSLITDLTLEACFSHPKHGGNRGGRAWDIMQGALKKSWFDA